MPLVLTVYMIVPLTAVFSPRVFTHCPSHRVALLHAPPPPDLLPPLQRVVSAGRIGRLRGAILQPVDHLRRRAGYGHRSLQHRLSARFPQFRVAPVGDRFPGADLPRPGEPLHAHVRDTKHGRPKPEPQECGGDSELGALPVLSQQGERIHLLDAPRICFIP